MKSGMDNWRPLVRVMGSVKRLGWLAEPPSCSVDWLACSMLLLNFRSRSLSEGSKSLSWRALAGSSFGRAELSTRAMGMFTVRRQIIGLTMATRLVTDQLLEKDWF